MSTLSVIVSERRVLTPDICEFTLRPTDSARLPDFTPGAHITVQTPSGAMRRYSLVNDGEAPDHYRIAIKREPQSRGGSASMHDEADIGTTLLIEAPENSFPLKPANDYLLIAGGIGVTPIIAMANALLKRGERFRIIYCARSADEAAYLDDMSAAFGDRLTFHGDGGDPDKVYDFWDHFADVRDCLIYCCGPKGMLEEIDAISGHWPEGRVNVEDFKPVDVIQADDQAFDVYLTHSARTITVPADRSILEALRDAGIDTVSSCESGTCGTCKTRLVEGDVEHRDQVLMDEERNDYIMICVSRAQQGNLTLEL